MNLEKIKTDIEAIVKDKGYLFEDVSMIKNQFGNVLQVMIDHEDGIDIEACVLCSEAIGLYLDSEDPIAEDYQLEVTSPGAERVLKNDKDYQRFLGYYVLARTEEQEYLGTLDSFDEFVVRLKIRNKLIQINRYELTLIRLAIKF